MIHVLLTWELSCNVMIPLRFYFHLYFSVPGVFFLKKPLKEACTSLSWVDYGKV